MSDSLVYPGTGFLRLQQVEELSNGVRSCFQSLGRELPPWRTKQSLHKLYKVRPPALGPAF